MDNKKNKKLAETIPIAFIRIFMNLFMSFMMIGNMLICVLAITTQIATSFVCIWFIFSNIIFVALFYK